MKRKYLINIIVCIIAFSSLSFRSSLVIATNKTMNNYSPISPDKLWQSELKIIYQSKDETSFFCELGKLMALPQDSMHKKLLRQLLYFGSNSENSQASLMVIRILTHLQIHKMYVASAIAPQLESDNENIKKLANYMLGYVDERSRLRKPDFSYYQSLLSGNKHNNKEPLIALINLMYRIHPNEALQVTGGVYSGKRSRKMEYLTRYLVYKSLLENDFNQGSKLEINIQTKNALKIMAKDGRWWEKLYVNAVFRKYKFLNSETSAPPRVSIKIWGFPITKINSPRGELIIPQFVLSPTQLRTKAAPLSLPQMT